MMIYEPASDDPKGDFEKSTGMKWPEQHPITGEPYTRASWETTQDVREIQRLLRPSRPEQDARALPELLRFVRPL